MKQAPVYRVAVPNEVAKVISSLHPRLKRKVRQALDAAAADPMCGKALQDDLEGLRSIRIGKFRLIYRLVRPRQVDVFAFGPRTSIYEETLRLIKKESGE